MQIAPHSIEDHQAVISVDNSDVADDLDSTPILYYQGKWGRANEIISVGLSIPAVEVFMCLLVLINRVLVAWSTFPRMGTALPVARNSANSGFPVCRRVCRTMWFVSPHPLRHMWCLPFFVEVLAAIICSCLFGFTPLRSLKTRPRFLPLWLVGSGSLLHFELLRVVRFHRVLRDLETFSKFLIALGLRQSRMQEWQFQMARVTAGMIYAAEHVVNPVMNSADMKAPENVLILFCKLNAVTTNEDWN